MGAFERAEQRILCLAIQDAVRLAGEGEVSGGYRCLMAGLARVQEYVVAGERWAEEIVRDYRNALGTFEELVSDPRSYLPATARPHRQQPQRRSTA